MTVPESMMVGTLYCVAATAKGFPASEIAPNRKKYKLFSLDSVIMGVNLKADATSEDLPRERKPLPVEVSDGRQ